MPSEYGDLYLDVEHQWSPLEHILAKLRAEVKRQLENKIVSVAQVSRLSGLSRTMIANFIRGSEIRDVHNTSKLSTALGLDDYIFSDWPTYGPYVEGTYVRRVIQTKKGGKLTRKYQRMMEDGDFWASLVK